MLRLTFFTTFIMFTASLTSANDSMHSRLAIMPDFIGKPVEWATNPMQRANWPYDIFPLDCGPHDVVAQTDPAPRSVFSLDTRRVAIITGSPKLTLPDQNNRPLHEYDLKLNFPEWSETRFMNWYRENGVDVEITRQGPGVPPKSPDKGTCHSVYTDFQISPAPGSAICPSSDTVKLSMKSSWYPWDCQ